MIIEPLCGLFWLGIKLGINFLVGNKISGVQGVVMVTRITRIDSVALKHIQGIKYCLSIKTSPRSSQCVIGV